MLAPNFYITSLRVPNAEIDPFSSQLNDQPLNGTVHNPRDVATKQVSKAQVQVQVQVLTQHLDISLLIVKVLVKKHVTVSASAT